MSYECQESLNAEIFPDNPGVEVGVGLGQDDDDGILPEPDQIGLGLGQDDDEGILPDGFKDEDEEALLQRPVEDLTPEERLSRRRMLDRVRKREIRKQEHDQLVDDDGGEISLADRRREEDRARKKRARRAAKESAGDKIKDQMEEVLESQDDEEMEVVSQDEENDFSEEDVEEEEQKQPKKRRRKSKSKRPRMSVNVSANDERFAGLTPIERRRAADRERKRKIRAAGERLLVQDVYRGGGEGDFLPGETLADRRRRMDRERMRRKRQNQRESQAYLASSTTGDNSTPNSATQAASEKRRLKRAAQDMQERAKTALHKKIRDEIFRLLSTPVEYKFGKELKRMPADLTKVDGETEEAWRFKQVLLTELKLEFTEIENFLGEEALELEVGPKAPTGTIDNSGYEASRTLNPGQNCGNESRGGSISGNENGNLKLKGSRCSSTKSGASDSENPLYAPKTPADFVQIKMEADDFEDEYDSDGAGFNINDWIVHSIVDANEEGGEENGNGGGDDFTIRRRTWIKGQIIRSKTVSSKRLAEFMEKLQAARLRWIRDKPFDTKIREDADRQRMELRENVVKEKHYLIDKVKGFLAQKRELYSKETPVERDDRIRREYEKMQEQLLQQQQKLQNSNTRTGRPPKDSPREPQPPQAKKEKPLSEIRAQRNQQSRTKFQMERLNFDFLIELLALRDEFRRHQMEGNDLTEILSKFEDNLEKLAFQRCIEYWDKFKSSKMPLEAISYNRMLYRFRKTRQTLSDAVTIPSLDGVRIERVSQQQSLQDLQDLSEFLDKSDTIVREHLEKRRFYIHNIVKKHETLKKEQRKIIREQKKALSKEIRKIKRRSKKTESSPFPSYASSHNMFPPSSPFYQGQNYGQGSQSNFYSPFSAPMGTSHNHNQHHNSSTPNQMFGGTPFNEYSSNASSVDGWVDMDEDEDGWIPVGAEYQDRQHHYHQPQQGYNLSSLASSTSAPSQTPQPLQLVGPDAQFNVGTSWAGTATSTSTYNQTLDSHSVRQFFPNSALNVAPHFMTNPPQNMNWNEQNVNLSTSHVPETTKKRSRKLVKAAKERKRGTGTPRKPRDPTKPRKPRKPRDPNKPVKKRRPKGSEKRVRASFRNLPEPPTEIESVFLRNPEVLQTSFSSPTLTTSIPVTRKFFGYGDRKIEENKTARNTESQETDNDSVIEIDPESSTVQEKLTCEMCSMECFSKAMLLRHICAVHYEQELHACPLSIGKTVTFARCVARKYGRTRLVDHLKRHGNLRSKRGDVWVMGINPIKDICKAAKFICLFCGESYNTYSELKEHYKVAAHGLKKYQCPSCGICLLKEDHFLDHLLLFHPEANYPQTMAREMNREFPSSKLFPCRYCHCEFTTEKFLQEHSHNAQHEKTEEKETREFECYWCLECHDSLSSLNQHVSKAHKEEPPVPSDEARKMETKTFDHSPYKCELCPKSFLSLYSLRFHFISRHDLAQYLTEMKEKYPQMKTAFVEVNGSVEPPVKANPAENRPSRKGKTCVRPRVPLTCPICSDVMPDFHWAHGMYDRLRRKHCDICSKLFSTINNLVAHNEKAHDIPPSQRQQEIFVPIGRVGTKPPPGISQSDWHPCPFCVLPHFTSDEIHGIHSFLELHSSILYKACPHCGVSLVMGNPFRNHIHEVHGVPKDEKRKFWKGKPRKDLQSSNANSNLQLDEIVPHLFSAYTTSIGKEELNIFSCKVCLKNFSSQSFVETHIKAVHKQDAFTRVLCTQCNATFATKANLRIHVKTKHRVGRVRVICPLCDEHFLDRAAIRKHLRNKHKEEKATTWDLSNVKTILAEEVENDKSQFFCKICSRNLRSAGALKAHMASKHFPTQVASFCTICGEQLLTKRMKDHVARHADSESSKRTKLSLTGMIDLVKGLYNEVSIEELETCTEQEESTEKKEHKPRGKRKREKRVVKRKAKKCRPKKAKKVCVWSDTSSDDDQGEDEEIESQESQAAEIYYSGSSSDEGEFEAAIYPVNEEEEDDDDEEEEELEGENELDEDEPNEAEEEDGSPQSENGAEEGQETYHRESESEGEEGMSLRELFILPAVKEETE